MPVGEAMLRTTARLVHRAKHSLAKVRSQMQFGNESGMQFGTGAESNISAAALLRLAVLARFLASMASWACYPQCTTI